MTLLSRVAREGSGWVATCPIAIPALLPPDTSRWLRTLAWELRLTFRGPVTRTVLLARPRSHPCPATDGGSVAGAVGDDDPYADGVLYDLEYALHDEDIDWYVLHARRAVGPVLELGCGTGRLTLPIARAGVSVVGVDRAPEMLRTLVRKLAHEAPATRDRVQTIESDYRTLEPGRTFQTVLWPFNALHHCDGAADLTETLRRIRGWCRGGGRLVLDCYLPDIELYDRDPDDKYEPRWFVDPRSGGTLESWEQGWWDADERVHHVMYTYRHRDGREERSHLALHMYELAEVHTILAAAGWVLVQEAQDFVGTPVRAGALKWVGVATPAPP